MRISFPLLLLLLLVARVTCDGEEKYISCTGIGDYCADHGTALQNTRPSVSHSTFHHRIGKAGPKGQKGEPGPLGPSVEVDYAGMERRILTKVKEMITNCRVLYNNSCFILVGRSGNKYSKEDFQRKCENIGGNLANLYNEEHRVMVSRYVRNDLGVYAQIALGMTYNPQANTFHLTTGILVNIEFTWHPGYPKPQQVHQNMYFSVQPDVASASQGAFNHQPYSDAFGLCEYDIGF